MDNWVIIAVVLAGVVSILILAWQGNVSEREKTRRLQAAIAAGLTPEQAERMTRG